MNRIFKALVISGGLSIATIGFANVNEVEGQQTNTQNTHNITGSASEGHKYLKVDLKTSDGESVKAIIPKEDAKLMEKGDKLEVTQQIPYEKKENDGWF